MFLRARLPYWDISKTIGHSFRLRFAQLWERLAGILSLRGLWFFGILYARELCWGSDLDRFKLEIDRYLNWGMGRAQNGVETIIDKPWSYWQIRLEGPISYILSHLHLRFQLHSLQHYLCISSELQGTFNKDRICSKCLKCQEKLRKKLHLHFTLHRCYLPTEYFKHFLYLFQNSKIFSVCEKCAFVGCFSQSIKCFVVNHNICQFDFFKFYHGFFDMAHICYPSQINPSTVTKCHQGDVESNHIGLHSYKGYTGQEW